MLPRELGKRHQPFPIVGLPYRWYYRFDFDSIVGSRRLSGAGNFVVVVLLDGTVVEPKITPQ
jgi:hypothetical protein